MNKIFIYYVIITAIFFSGGFLLFKDRIYNEKQIDLANDYKNATYIIDGRSISLKDGVSETEITPGSASKVVTRYFGNEVYKDLDGDGREDVVFLLTQETGGSGTFFYVVAALNIKDGYIGSQGLLLGDRIAPQTTESGGGKIIIVNYADRALGESFAIQPSVGKSIWLLLDPKTMQFGEVAQNFEGEADPNKMTLGMKTWKWIKTKYNNDTELKPKNFDAFTLTFRNNGTFSATTDCNSISGAYEMNDHKIVFKDIATTLMFCENSQEQEFLSMLGKVQSYFFTSRGELVFDLKLDSGSSIFR